MAGGFAIPDHVAREEHARRQAQQQVATAIAQIEGMRVQIGQQIFVRLAASKFQPTITAMGLGPPPAADLDQEADFSLHAAETYLFHTGYLDKLEALKKAMSQPAQESNGAILLDP